MEIPSPRSRQRDAVLCVHVTSDPYGGSDRSLFALASRMRAERFRPVVVLAPGPMAARYRAVGVAVYEVAMPPLRRSLMPHHHLRFLCGFRRAVSAIRRIAIREDVALVYANSSINLYAPRVARLLKLPLVHHVRELGNTSRLLVAGIRRWADCVVVNSAAVGAHFGVDDAVVIHNGVDLTRFDAPATTVRAEYPTLGENPYAVIASRLDSWKGHRTFLHAAARVRSRVPSARFLVVDGEVYSRPEIKRELLALTHELGLDDVVLFTGPRDDVPGILAEAHVVVSAASEPEPFGRVVIEGMAARRPVVATAAGGHLETVVAGETGLLVPCRDDQAMAAALARLFAEPGLAERMGAAGRARVEAEFSLPVHGQRMLAVFDRVLGRAAPAARRVLAHGRPVEQMQS